MKRKIIAAALAVSVVASFGTVSLTADAVDDAAVSMQSAAAVNSVVLNSAAGATADDIEAAISDFGSAGGKITLIGDFRINSTIMLCSNLTINANMATVTGNAELLFAAYEKKNITFTGGTWTLGSSSRLMKITKSTGCLIEKMTVDGGGSFDYGELLLYNTKNATVRNCTFRNIRSQVVFAAMSDNFVMHNCKVSNANGHGVYVYLSDSPKVLKNKFDEICGDGIKLVKCSKGTVSGNTVNNVTFNPILDIDPLRKIARSGCGLLLSECEDTHIGSQISYNGSLYSGNTVSNCENYGIHITMCRKTELTNDSFTDIGTDGIHNSAAAQTTISGCYFKNCKEKAIFFVPGPIDDYDKDCRDCKNSVIYNNKIKKCGTFGIMLSVVDTVKVEKNTISDCGDYGVYCNSSKNVSISGCSISNTKQRVGLGVSSSPDCTNINIDLPFRLAKSSMSMGIGDNYKIEAPMNDLIWKSSNSKIVTVSNGKLRAVGIGSAVITASTKSGQTAKCEVTVKGVASSVSLNKTDLVLGVGEDYKLTAILPANTASASVTFRTSDSSIVSMQKTDGEGVFTALKPGTAWVSVKLCNGKQASCKVIVRYAPNSVSFSKSSYNMHLGQSINPEVVIPSDSAAQNRTFASSNTSVASVSSDGTIKAVGYGSAVITVKLYNGKTASCKVVVNSLPSKISFNQTSVSIGVGENIKNVIKEISGTIPNGSTFTSSNRAVATVTSDGTVKGIKTGTAIITIKLSNGAKATYKIIVRKAPARVSLNYTSLKLKVGQTASVSAVIASDSASASRTYRSSDSSVVKMTKTYWTGSFQAMKPGTAWVTLRLYNGKQASCKVVVTK